MIYLHPGIFGELLYSLFVVSSAALGAGHKHRVGIRLVSPGVLSQREHRQSVYSCTVAHPCSLSLSINGNRMVK